MTNYTDYQLAKLLFGPEGIEQYLKDGSFQKRFGVRYTRDNLTDVIAKVVPEIDRKNKDRKVMQPLVTHFNLIEKKQKKKDSESHADALGKALEILYVFILNNKTRIDGLRERVEKQGYGDLIEHAKSIYEERLDEYKRVLQVHDAIQTIGSNIEGIREEIADNQREILDAILKTRKQELQEAENEFNETVDELLSLIKGTPKKQYPELIENLTKYLENIKKIM